MRKLTTIESHSVEKSGISYLIVRLRFRDLTVNRSIESPVLFIV